MMEAAPFVPAYIPLDLYNEEIPRFPDPTTLHQIEDSEHMPDQLSNWQQEFKIKNKEATRHFNKLADKLVKESRNVVGSIEANRKEEKSCCKKKDQSLIGIEDENDGNLEKQAKDMIKKQRSERK